MYVRNEAKTIIICFDKYFSPSIKDDEHTRRGTVRGTQYSIHGPDQTRPSDFFAELKNICFKKALVNFLIQDWERDDLASFIGNKTVYVNYILSFKYEVVDGHVIRSREDHLSCPSHEEADTKIIFHICQIEKDSSVVIRSADTDVLIITLANVSFVKENVRIFLKAGVGNNERYIDVSKLHKKLGTDLCEALPLFHSFTGCDFTPAFFKKGKKRPFALLQNSAEFIEAFRTFSLFKPESTDIAIFEKFVCAMYGCKKINTVNEARLAIFMRNSKCHHEDANFKIHAKSFDASTLPPCQQN